MNGEIKKSLGELVMAFSMLEDSLSEGLAQVLNINYEEAKILFSTVSFKIKTKTINALLRKYDDFCNGDLIFKLLSKSNGLEEKRNAYIHSDWEMYFKPQTGEDSGLLLKREKLKYKRKNKVEFFKENFGSEELKILKETTEEIKKCALDLFDEFGQIGQDIKIFK